MHDPDREPHKEKGEPDERAAFEADALFEPLKIATPRYSESFMLRINLGQNRKNHSLVAERGERGEINLTRDVKSDCADLQWTEGQEDCA